MKLFLSLSLAAAFIGSPRIHAAPAATPMPDPVVVKGKGFEIKQSKVNQVLNSARVNSATPDEVPSPEVQMQNELHVMYQLIELQLVLQKATVAEKADGQREGDLAFTNALTRLGPQELKQRLQAARMTEDDLRAMLAEEATAKESMTRQLGINMTDARVRKHYDTYPQISQEPERVRVREILLSAFDSSNAPLSAEKLNAKRKLIDELHQRVLAGEDFATLARQYSENIYFKENGGELPPFQTNEMEFGNVAFTLKTNEVSTVITNEEGYAFIQLLEKIPARKISFAELAPRIKNALIVDQKQQLAPAYMKKLKAEAGLQILDAKLKAAAEANEAEAEASAKSAAESLAATIAQANSPEQKEAEAKVFGWGTNRPPARP